MSNRLAHKGIVVGVDGSSSSMQAANQDIKSYSANARNVSPVIVGVDGSQAAIHAAEWAVRIGLRPKCSASATCDLPGGRPPRCRTGRGIASGGASRG